MGATLVPGAANFSIFSRSAGGMELLLFDRADTQGRLSVFTPECDLRNVGFTSSTSLIILHRCRRNFSGRTLPTTI